LGAFVIQKLKELGFDLRTISGHEVLMIGIEMVFKPKMGRSVIAPHDLSVDVSYDVDFSVAITPPAQIKDRNVMMLL